ncbi:ADP-dependent NAD(P)H-hydrate dehydratase [Mycetocola reblochoni]|uniref:ADP-dependent (S)-NAD(P)H-hydrate dehydratase n=2 Tax=Mycetocola reblochoni TaxID=331618 RepID=A0A1R4K270_9MICO|nr:ADP/ATP-dependent (S)-NAD(P)H-hydrate dehydratase [Mycetocola reblochoni]RLP70427.1 NAD(P)H-hydrate dehydratase [Mycetocola reblochoni]SJN38274.1 NAD(P)HX epimerase / NAD(P)HX dehydratase [Mycetocola reblochoni REB411]
MSPAPHRDDTGAPWTRADAAGVLVRPGPGDHKYTRGVVGLCTGSARYPGAAVLGAEAALRTGPGMLRYLGPAETARAVLARRPECVPGPGRVQVLVLGSGMDAAEARRRWLGLRHDGTRAGAAAGPDVSAGTDGGTAGADAVPVVLDAGAIGLVGSAVGDGHPVVVTPHAGELAALFAQAGEGRFGTRAAVEAEPELAALTAARRWGAVVLLKGAATHVATPRGRRLRVEVGTHWLASAGTGDVLAGCLGTVLASLAARGRSDDDALAEGAATAALLHARAAELASGGGPLLALELAEALAPAVAELLTHAADAAPAETAGNGRDRPTP